MGWLYTVKEMAVSANKDSFVPLVMGGYDCDFLEPFPDSLQCPVCLLPFRDPVLLSCCGHKGCASCIGRIKAAGHPCPLCQQPFETMLDKLYQRKVLDLRVFCSKRKEGCRWKGELRDIDTHLRRACVYGEEECRYGCGERYQRRLLPDHEMYECPQRPPEVINVTQSLVEKMAQQIDKLHKAHQEDQTKLAAIQAKLASVEEAHDEDRENLVAMKKVHHEEHAKHSWQIEQLQNQNSTLQDQKGQVTKKMEELASQFQEGWFFSRLKNC